MNNKRRLIADDDAFDENGRLRDGHTARVPVQLRDGIPAPPVRRRALDAAEHAALNSCRHGFRYANTADDSMAERRAWARDAYTTHEYELANAWRNPPLGLGRLRDDYGNGGRFGSVGREGDTCTVRDGGVNEGAAGHLRRVGGRLVCVPDDEDDDPAFDDSAFNDAQMDAEQYRELVYQEYARSISRAWRRG
jgi:hypothetical protein